VYIAEDDLPALKPNQLYQDKIIGYLTIDQNECELGQVIDLMISKEQTLLKVDHNGDEVLIPFVEEFIIKIDKRKKILYLDLPDGLIDLNK
jgi:16S rRNA processing protein RimM